MRRRQAYHPIDLRHIFLAEPTFSSFARFNTSINFHYSNILFKTCQLKQFDPLQLCAIVLCAIVLREGNQNAIFQSRRNYGLRF